MIHATVEQKLAAAFPGATLEVIDTSAGHEKHNHLTNLAVTVLWSGFKDVSLIDQHRRIHEALAEELKTEIHAIRIKSGTTKT